MQFPFPYHEPYQVQKDFMNDLYAVIDSGKIGLFESPTVSKGVLPNLRAPVNL
jgi:chromosome transmission fidelity protein 1